ncbi:MAG: putative Ig domain-containing protein, partial [Pseudomonadota bacterium]
VWTQQEKLIANDGAAGDNFGISVALSGDTVVVGADSDTIGANAFQGSAYVFTNSGSWYQQQKLTAADGAAFDSFGRSVALSGDTVVVGASADDIGTNGDQGSAYVFVSPPCPAITIAPASLPNGALGAAYNQPLSTSGEAAAYQYSVSRGVLPPGLTLNPLGLLLGTPTAAGTYRFTITATHVLSLCPGSRAYTITVTSPCPTITISPATLPNGAVGATYNQTVTATGGLGQHSFAVTAGALPPGLSMNVFGSLRGAPTQAGSYNFTVTATSNGCTGTRAYTLTIGSPGCDYSVTPKNHAFPSEGGNGVVSVNAGAGCAWTAVSNDPMITITSGANGSGAGTVRFAVAKNPNAGARRG